MDINNDDTWKNVVSANKSRLECANGNNVK